MTTLTTAAPETARRAFNTKMLTACPPTCPILQLATRPATRMAYPLSVPQPLIGADWRPTHSVSANAIALA